MTDKETQGKLDLLAALLAGGVENWEGYDLATEEHRKAIAREENFERIRAHVEGLSYLYYNTEECRKEAVRIILRQVKELCDDKS